MNESIVNLTPIHPGYATARAVLRDHQMYDLDAIDAAFEILAYSQDPADRALCRVIEDEMWLVPSPGASVIAVTMLAVALTCIGLATLVGRLIL
jgi:hypothetical protein